jgi:hypothetical protein
MGSVGLPGGLALLARAADWLEPAAPLFAEFAGGDVRRQVLAAVQATLTGESGRYLLDTVLAGQLGSSGPWTTGQLEELQGQIPQYVLLRTHVAIAELVVAAFRALATDNPDAHNPELAPAGVRAARHEAAGRRTRCRPAGGWPGGLVTQSR